MTPKERADKTVIALKERQRAKERKQRDLDSMILGVTIDSIAKRRGRTNPKYFY